MLYNNRHIHKILIANRGEIAVRIIRSCKEMGILTVAVYSEVDKEAMHVKLADEAICIGEAPAKESYLNRVNILSAAEVLQVDAIHPGFGFLSENSTFCKICEASGIKFIGPNSEIIKLVGDKAKARQVMKKNGVPVVEGYEGKIDDLRHAKQIARDIGYPVIIKAALGGGGKGIRVVEGEKEFETAYNAAMAEAQACFGDGELYLEKYIKGAKHIEFQILADSYGNIVHLGDRECSLQRKNQKVVEETPSPSIGTSLRHEMGEMAKRAARAVGYTNAGTVEFILDECNHYFFIEINARIQVEHPITEMVTGIDLIKQQLKISLGEELAFTQEKIEIRGHAIECRINAEDPRHDFKPSLGTIEEIVMPGGMGIRIDSSIYRGDTISHYYDSMIAKIIAHGSDRSEAITKMERALDELSIQGIISNIEYLKWILQQEKFIRGDYDTSFLEENKVLSD